MFSFLGLVVLATVQVGFAAPQDGYGYGYGYASSSSSSSIPTFYSDSSSLNATAALNSTSTLAYGYDGSLNPSATATLGYGYGFEEAGGSGTPVPGFGYQEAGVSGTPVPGYGYQEAGVSGVSIPSNGYDMADAYDFSTLTRTSTWRPTSTYTSAATETTGTTTLADGYYDLMFTPSLSVPTSATDGFIASGNSIPAYSSYPSNTFSLPPSDYSYAAAEASGTLTSGDGYYDLMFTPSPSIPISADSGLIASGTSIPAVANALPSGSTYAEAAAEASGTRISGDGYYDLMNASLPSDPTSANGLIAAGTSIPADASYTSDILNALPSGYTYAEVAAEASGTPTMAGGYYDLMGTSLSSVPTSADASLMAAGSFDTLTALPSKYTYAAAETTVTPTLADADANLLPTDASGSLDALGSLPAYYNYAAAEVSGTPTLVDAYYDPMGASLPSVPSPTDVSLLASGSFANLTALPTNWTYAAADTSGSSISNDGYYDLMGTSLPLVPTSTGDVPIAAANSVPTPADVAFETSSALPSDHAYAAAEASGTPTLADAYYDEPMGTPLPSIPTSIDNFLVAGAENSVPTDPPGSFDSLNALVANHTYAAVEAAETPKLADAVANLVPNDGALPSGYTYAAAKASEPPTLAGAAANFLPSDAPGSPDILNALPPDYDYAAAEPARTPTLAAAAANPVPTPAGVPLMAAAHPAPPDAPGSPDTLNSPPSDYANAAAQIPGTPIPGNGPNPTASPPPSVPAPADVSLNAAANPNPAYAPGSLDTMGALPSGYAYNAAEIPGTPNPGDGSAQMPAPLPSVPTSPDNALIAAAANPAPAPADVTFDTPNALPSGSAYAAAGTSGIPPLADGYQPMGNSVPPVPALADASVASGNQNPAFASGSLNPMGAPPSGYAYNAAALPGAPMSGDGSAQMAAQMAAPPPSAPALADTSAASGYQDPAYAAGSLDALGAPPSGNTYSAAAAPPGAPMSGDGSAQMAAQMAAPPPSAPALADASMASGNQDPAYAAGSLDTLGAPPSAYAYNAQAPPGAPMSGDGSAQMAAPPPSAPALADVPLASGNQDPAYAAGSLDTLGAPPSAYAYDAAALPGAPMSGDRSGRMAAPLPSSPTPADASVASGYQDPAYAAGSLDTLGAPPSGYAYGAATPPGAPMSGDGFAQMAAPLLSSPTPADASVASGYQEPAYAANSLDTLGALPSGYAYDAAALPGTPISGIPDPAYAPGSLDTLGALPSGYTYDAAAPISSSGLNLGHGIGSATSELDEALQSSDSSWTNGSSGIGEQTCPGPATQLQLTDLPYKNYFYSDCHTSAQVVVTSPQPGNNLTIIGPRLLVAWPAGNSGVVAFFSPENGINGTLSIELENMTSGDALGPVFLPPPPGSQYAKVGVFGRMKLNDSAVLALPILGSVRTIRDFTEGPSLLAPEIQNAIEFSEGANGGLGLSRLWLDNMTMQEFGFSPIDDGKPIRLENKTAVFEAGSYTFMAYYNYPQLDQLSPQEVLNNRSQELISQQLDQTTSLSFLSYRNKLLAGAWRFLTYFGRDSMISLLLLEPVLSEGEGGAMEAGIAAVLERLNKTDGSAAHEETIGDYATYLNLKNNISSTAPQYDYKMVDTDFYLPVLLQQYFVTNPIGSGRSSAFFSQSALENPDNANLTYGQLALRNAERIMTLAEPFAGNGNQTKDNLIHLKEGQIVGEWRDSTYGLGGGRIPYDVNTALVPAALRSIAALARAGLFSEYPNWATDADRIAQVWEDETLKFFEVRIPREEAKQRVETYVSRSQFAGPSQTESIDDDVTFYAVALEGNNDLEQVQVMNSDDSFRHFFLNTTNQEQLTGYINQTANNIQRIFPTGLMTSVGVVVANPAYGVEPVYAQNFTNGAYHGTVVWSWNSLSMMARGLELQLDRCNSSTQAPDFCKDSVYGNVKTAYNKLWDVIEANSQLLSSEVWSWEYQDNDFQYTTLGEIPPPPGVGGATESDIRQLWSLTFLAVKRNASFR
ncbi:MAG: hypothetical protein M1816_004445 [Peltula sp. TS41687]|nr:MAG: hypothetical protein M1816_004445 [Peltula sp. TS41687]